VGESLTTESEKIEATLLIVNVSDPAGSCAAFAGSVLSGAVRQTPPRTNAAVAVQAIFRSSTLACDLARVVRRVKAVNSRMCAPYFPWRA